MSAGEHLEEGQHVARGRAEVVEDDAGVAQAERLHIAVDIQGAHPVGEEDRAAVVADGDHAF